MISRDRAIWVRGYRETTSTPRSASQSLETYRSNPKPLQPGKVDRRRTTKRPSALSSCRALPRAILDLRRTSLKKATVASRTEGESRKRRWSRRLVDRTRPARSVRGESGPGSGAAPGQAHPRPLPGPVPGHQVCLHLTGRGPLWMLSGGEAPERSNVQPRVTEAGHLRRRGSRNAPVRRILGRSGAQRSRGDCVQVLTHLILTGRFATGSRESHSNVFRAGRFSGESRERSRLISSFQGVR